jgi:hypothetical protein
MLKGLLTHLAVYRVNFYDLFGGERRDVFLDLSVPPAASSKQQILEVRFPSNS